MDLLKTILVYMTLVFVSSVQSAPEPTIVPTDTPAPPSVIETLPPTLEPKPSYTPVPTPDITPNREYKTLKIGDKGKNVKALQIKLQELGYYMGDIDSGFGGQTRKAVEQFQYQNGLSVDGIAGKRTLTVLYEYDKVVPAPKEVAATPTPTSTLAPTVSPTVAPTDTPEPTDTPIPTFAPTATPTLAPTATPILPDNLTVIDKAEIWLSGGEKALTDADGKLLRPARAKDASGDLIPIMELLYAADIMVVPSVSGDTYEFAFMLDEENMYYLAYRLLEDGSVADLTIDLNRGELTAVPMAAMIGQTLYLPVDRAMSTLGIMTEWDEKEERLTVIMP